MIEAIFIERIEFFVCLCMYISFTKMWLSLSGCRIFHFEYGFSVSITKWISDAWWYTYSKHCTDGLHALGWCLKKFTLFSLPRSRLLIWSKKVALIWKILSKNHSEIGFAFSQYYWNVFSNKTINEMEIFSMKISWKKNPITPP